MQLGGIDIIGWLGLLLGIVFYYKSKVEKRPTFVYQDTLLQSRSYSDITIYFREEKISSLRRLRVLFFNKGRKEIRSEDNPKNTFPTIDLPVGTRIVASNILGTSNSACSLQAKRITDTSLELSFDYLNHKDGGVIEILYDGGEVRKPEIKFAASIIGACSARSFKFETDEQNPKVIFTAFMASMSLFMGYVGVGSFISTFAKLHKDGFGGDIVGYFVFAALITFVAASGVWLTFVSPFRNAAPKWAKPHFGEYK